MDVSILQNNLLAPVLKIGDPRTDDRIGFVGGIRGLEELERKVDSGKFAVAFSMYPTLMQEVMSVADAGQIMPPKSTWFEPKLRDGMVVHRALRPCLWKYWKKFRRNCWILTIPGCPSWRSAIAALLLKKCWKKPNRI